MSIPPGTDTAKSSMGGGVHLALFPGPAQLSVTYSTEKWFARGESLETRLGYTYSLIQGS